MPRFHRRSRLLNRIFFALVIAAGLYGWYVGARYWQPDPSALDLNAFVGGADWIELIAGLLEERDSTLPGFHQSVPAQLSQSARSPLLIRAFRRVDALLTIPGIQILA